MMLHKYKGEITFLKLDFPSKSYMTYASLNLLLEHLQSRPQSVPQMDLGVAEA
jgi:hypothetical protein